MVPFNQATYLDGKLASELVLSSVAFNLRLPDSLFTIPQ